MVVQATAQVTCDDKVFPLKENESTFIPLGSTHRLENLGREPLRLIEVQSGSYLARTTSCAWKTFTAARPKARTRFGRFEWHDRNMQLCAAHSASGGWRESGTGDRARAHMALRAPAARSIGLRGVDIVRRAAHFLRYNSDTLLPSAWAEIVLREHHAFGAFQLPRTTSLFPDFTVHSILQLATGSWRTATLLYGWLQFAALIAASGLIVRQITGASFWLGAAVFTLLVVLLFALDGLDGRSNLTRTRIVVEIVAHGGAFLLTLFAASLVCRMLTRGATRAGMSVLFILSLLAYFSDQLAVFEFAVPTALVLALDWRNVDWRMAGGRILAPIIFGMGLAHLLLYLINTQAMGLHISFAGWGVLFRR